METAIIYIILDLNLHIWKLLFSFDPKMADGESTV